MWNILQRRLWEQFTVIVTVSVYTDFNMLLERRKGMSYIDLIKERAKIDRKTIVLPETTDKRTLIAAAKIVE